MSALDSIRSLYAEPERPETVEWPALQCHDVFKIFRSGDVETVALRGLELRVERQELVAVLGTPSAGEVRVFGHSLSMLDEAELARYRARQLAIVFQADNLWPSLSALENVAVSLQLAGVDGRDGDTLAALRHFGLGERAHHRVSALSGGEQQRVAIAAAAARRAPLVLADEPTGELDAANEQVVLDSLRALRDDYQSTVVVVTHSERVAAAVDRVIEIRDGRATRENP
jgi:ABC-type lipoprotein export system ATPase subunit